MANHSVIAFEYLHLSNIGICGAVVPKELSTSFSINDTSHIFSRYKQNNGDVFNIDNRGIGVNSRFVKRIIDFGFQLIDDSNQAVHYRPSLSDGVEFTDTSEGHIWTPQSAEDTLVVRTRAYGEVNYKNVGSDLSTMIFGDSSLAIVSRLLVRNFKNAIYPLIGTTEITVYTCAVKTTTVLNISVCNVALSDIIISVMIYKGGVTQTYLIKDVEIPTASCFVINNNGESSIILEEDDEIRIISDTINSSDVYVALFEQS